MPEKDWVSFDCVIFDHAVGYLTSLRRSKRPKDFFFFFFLWELGLHVWRNWLSVSGHTGTSLLGHWVFVVGRWPCVFIPLNPHKTLGKSSK